MRRGFKAQAERIANEYRDQLGCDDEEPVSVPDLASMLDVELVAADQLVSRTRLQELEELQPGAFSAGTFRLPDGQRVVVYNPLHALGRQRSDQAHELAHLMLDHTVRTIARVGSLKLITCDTEQEEEADWLGGCLLLPRPVLLKAAFDGLGPADIADKHKTSEHMARFRLNASGVLVQVGRSKASKRRRRSK